MLTDYKTVGDLELNIGDKVTYMGYGGKKEFGIVKSFNLMGEPFVVYHCKQDWGKFKNYTGALTMRSNLKKGWTC